MSNNNTPKNELEYQYEREYRRIIQAVNRQKKLGYHIPEDIIPIKPSKAKRIIPEDVEKLIELTPKEIRKKSVYIDKETGESYKGLDVVNSHHKPKPSNANIRNPKARTKSITNTQHTGKTKGKDQQPKETDKHKQNKPKNKKHNNKKEKQPEQTAPPKENNLNMQIIDTINNMLDTWQPAPHWHGSFLERKTENYHKIQTIWKETLENEGEYETAYRLESVATELLHLVERILYSSDSSIEEDFNLGRFIELLIGRALSAVESDEYNEIAREAALETLRGENSVG